jgi:hypothetical protein
VYLSPIAQPISNNPAMIRIVQFITKPHRQYGSSRIGNEKLKSSSVSGMV